MFDNLMDLGFKRSRRQAVGFYIAWLVALVVAVGLIGALYGLVINVEEVDLEQANRIGTAVASIFSVVFTILILRSKGLLSEFSSILFIIFSGVLGVIGGGLFGLIIPAYLSTREKIVLAVGERVAESGSQQ